MGASAGRVHQGLTVGCLWPETAAGIPPPPALHQAPQGMEWREWSRLKATRYQRQLCAKHVRQTHKILSVSGRGRGEGREASVFGVEGLLLGSEVPGSVWTQQPGPCPGGRPGPADVRRTPSRLVLAGLLGLLGVGGTAGGPGMVGRMPGLGGPLLSGLSTPRTYKTPARGPQVGARLCDLQWVRWGRPHGPRASAQTGFHSKHWGATGSSKRGQVWGAPVGKPGVHLRVLPWPSGVGVYPKSLPSPHRIPRGVSGPPGLVARMARWH